MKKIFTLVLFALATVVANAQTKHTVNVWIDGQKTTIENVDSLTFVEEPKMATEYVDLGLSVKWATYNLGATKEDEAGNYYSWGETATKNEYEYTMGNYKYSDGSKYNDEDNKLNLDPEDDAATVALGADWRTPTYDEFNELITNCDWEWCTDKGINGMIGKSKINGNTIFLPAAGSSDEYGVDYVGKYVEFWTNERPYGKDYPYYIFGVKTAKGATLNIKNTYKYPGLPVRPVYVGK